MIAIVGRVKVRQFDVVGSATLIGQMLGFVQPDWQLVSNGLSNDIVIYGIVAVRDYIAEGDGAAMLADLEA